MSENKKYYGGAFYQDERLSAQFQLDPDTLLVEVQGSNLSKKLQLDWSEVELSQGGNANKLTYLKHPQLPEVTLFCSDPEFFKALKKIDHRHIQAQMPQLKKSYGSVNMAIYFGLGILVLSLIGFWMSKDYLVERAVDAIPLSWEEALGEQVMAQIKLTQPISSDSLLNDKVRQMAQPLLEQYPDRQFHFYFSGSSDVNAFAVPGGYIVVNRGLVERAQKLNEVQGVLAHELSHVTQRHSMKNIVSSLGMIFILQTFLGDLTGLAAVLTEGSSYFLTQKFSRDFERDADDKGLQLLVDAEIDPQGLVSFFEILQKVKEERMETLSEENQGRLETLEEWLSTHPATQERIDYLNEQISKIERKEWSSPSFDLESFQAELLERNKE